jgi:methionine-rich copper-binding protein CopC
MSVNDAKKYHINLLQAELLPDKDLITLSRVVVLWSVVLLLMIAWVIASHVTHNQLTEKLIVSQQENKRLSNQIEVLSSKVSHRKVNSQLTEQLAMTKLLLINKNALHAKLTNPNHTYVAGFADAMKELSQLHHKDIRLQAIQISNDAMTFSGLARIPEAVPAWLAGFESSILLSGKSFEHFQLSENEQHVTEFMVSSKIAKEMLP